MSQSFLNQQPTANGQQQVLLQFVFAVICALFISSPAMTAFEETGTGARASALGGAYVALGDDVSSLMYNPAGLSKLDDGEITAEYSQLFSGLSDGSNLGQYFMGYGQPVKKWKGSVAVGWRQMSLNDLYTERSINLGYGVAINKRLSLGFAGKQLFHSYGDTGMLVDNGGYIRSGTSSLFQQYGQSKGVFSMDVGLLYRVTPRYTLGLSIQDLLEPNVALSDRVVDRVNRTWRGGLAYQGRKGLIVTGAVTMKESLVDQRDFIFMGAAEKTWDTLFNGSYAVRGGLTKGSRELLQLSLGAGYNLPLGFSVDYGFIFSLSGITLGNTAGTHRLSLTYHLGQEGNKRIIIEKPMVENEPTLYEETMPQVDSMIIRNHLDLLSHLYFMLNRYTHGNKQQRHSLRSLEPVYEAMRQFYRLVNVDLLDQMEITATLEEAQKRYYEMKRENAPEDERLDYLVRSIEYYLEPIMRKRTWNMKDNRDVRYTKWLKDSWNFSHGLAERGASTHERIEFMRQVVMKGVDFERMPSEPIVETPGKPEAAAETVQVPPMEESQPASTGTANKGDRLVELQKLLDQCESQRMDCSQVKKEIDSLFAEVINAASAK